MNESVVKREFFFSFRVSFFLLRGSAEGYEIKSKRYVQALRDIYCEK